MVLANDRRGVRCQTPDQSTGTWTPATNTCTHATGAKITCRRTQESRQRSPGTDSGLLYSNCWDRNWPGLPRFQPGREVPDDHCHPLHRARHDPARLHRSQTARPRRVPGRIPRPDPRSVRAGPTPVHQLVPSPIPGLVRRPPRRHRKLCPGARSPGRARATVTPAAVHHRRVLQLCRSKKSSSSIPPPLTSAVREWTTSRTPSP